MWSLLLPWVDRGKSYGPAFRELGTALQHEWRHEDCMASLYLGESEAPMLHYFTGILHRPMAGDTVADADADAEGTPSCRWLIVQGRRHQAHIPALRWAPYWSGARQGDVRERLAVYRARDAH